MDTLKYLFRVIGPLAVKDAVPLDKLKERVMDILLSFIGGVFVTLILRTASAQSVDLDLPNILIVLVATFVLRFLPGLLIVSARLYKELGGFIENPFEISTLDPNVVFLHPTTQWAAIKVTNKSRIAKIEDCYLELVSIVDLMTNQSIWFESQKFSWSSREGGYQDIQEPITLHFESPAWCNIASVNINDNRADYLTWYGIGSPQNEIKPGKYRLIIKVYGIWQNHQISYSYSLDLTYQPDNEKRFAIENIRPVKEAP